jgi:pimeloyl-ACP methyl ester carboxylesterase
MSTPSHLVVGAADAPRTALVLHGILGAGRNWRGLARAWADAYPDWRFVLADLRCHGDAPPAQPPHTLAACAADLRALPGPSPELVIGHSFGGKVALCYARDAAAPPRAVWVLDSPPGTAPPDEREAVVVLAAVNDAPVPAPRPAIRAHLLARGLPESIVAWLLTSLVERPDGWVWKYDLPGIRALLDDFFRTDLWPFLDQPRVATHIDIVRAGRSDRWSDAEIARCAALSAESQVRVHLLPDAGHWVHVDDPEGVTRLIARDLT